MRRGWGAVEEEERSLSLNVNDNYCKTRSVPATFKWRRYEVTSSHKHDLNGVIQCVSSPQSLLPLLRGKGVRGSHMQFPLSSTPPSHFLPHSPAAISDPTSKWTEGIVGNGYVWKYFNWLVTGTVESWLWARWALKLWRKKKKTASRLCTLYGIFGDSPSLGTAPILIPRTRRSLPPQPPISPLLLVPWHPLHSDFTIWCPLTLPESPLGRT